MAGKKSFVPEEALSKAMESFWTQGYEATSMQDLVKSMGINRGSLYDTFGGKHDLFLASLDHYYQTQMSLVLKPLEAPGAGKQAIIDCVQAMVDRAASDAQQRGCLITNTAVELASHDDTVCDRIHRYLKRLELAFYNALVLARDQGELSYGGDLHPLAQFLTSSLQGLRVMSKASPDKAMLQGIANVIVATLD